MKNAAHPAVKREAEEDWGRTSLDKLNTFAGLHMVVQAKRTIARSVKPRAQPTVTLKHLAAKLAESHDITKKQTEAVLGDLVNLVTKHLRRATESASPASASWRCVCAQPAPRDLIRQAK
jgi:hypothetical protein